MIVHIGYQKTATTYLQEEVFPNFTDTHYVGYNNSEKLLNDNVNIATGNFLYSYEGLVGKRGVELYTENAKKLKSLGFKKVIITIRRQDFIIDSLYRQYITEGGCNKFNKWISKLNKSYYDYNIIINEYVNVFGIKNVLIIPCENISIEDIAKFCNTGYGNIKQKISNKSFSNVFIGIIRGLNSVGICTTKNYKLKFILKHIDIFKKKCLCGYILDDYNYNNLILNTKHNIGIEKYGYLNSRITN